MYRRYPVDKLHLCSILLVVSNSYPANKGVTVHPSRIFLNNILRFRFITRALLAFHFRLILRNRHKIVWFNGSLWNCLIHNQYNILPRAWMLNRLWKYEGYLRCISNRECSTLALSLTSPNKRYSVYNEIVTIKNLNQFHQQSRHQPILPNFTQWVGAWRLKCRHNQVNLTHHYTMCRHSSIGGPHTHCKRKDRLKIN